MESVSANPAVQIQQTRMPGELKLAEGGKGIPKRISRGLVPDAVIDRPKGYLPVPQLTHLEGDVLALVRDALTSERVERRGIFDPGHVEELLAAPNDHLTTLEGNKLWQVALLELWLEAHRVRIKGQSGSGESQRSERTNDTPSPTRTRKASRLIRTSSTGRPYQAFSPAQQAGASVPRLRLVFASAPVLDSPTNNLQEGQMSITATRIRQISLVCVPTIDQDKAIEFYESIGFEKRTDIAFGGRYRWVEVYPPEGTTGIALAPPPGEQEITPTQTGITLTTDDIDATYGEMKSRGVDVDAEVSRMGDPVPPMFWFRDPSGHSLMVVEQPANAA